MKEEVSPFPYLPVGQVLDEAEEARRDGVEAVGGHLAVHELDQALLVSGVRVSVMWCDGVGGG